MDLAHHSFWTNQVYAARRFVIYDATQLISLEVPSHFRCNSITKFARPLMLKGLLEDDARTARCSMHTVVERALEDSLVFFYFS